MKKLTAQNRVFGGVFCLILFSSIVEAQETVITTSEEPVVVIDSYEAALDGNGKSDLKIGEAVEPDFFNDIVDRIRGIFTNDDGSIEIGFLSGVFKSDTPALTIDAAGDAIFRGDLTARTIKSAGDLTVGSPEEPSKTEGKAITVGDKDRGVIELHGGDGQDIIAKGIVQMGDFGMELGTLTNQILKFFTNSTPRMSITSDGNVGIGTTSPGAKLEVNGELIQSKRSRKGYIYEQGNNSTKKYHYLGRIHSWCSAFRVSGHFEAHDANDRGTGIFDLSFAKRGAFKVNGFASGKFGDPVDIELYETTEGYNNGSYGPNLDVYLVTGLWALVNIDISETPGCGDKINTEEIVAQEKSATKHPSSSPYYKLSEDGVGFFADNSGNVGIGTTSPGAKLHVDNHRLDITTSAASGGGQNRFNGLIDEGRRGQLVLSSSYSDLVIASSQTNNSHGSTLTFATYNPSDATDYKKWVVNQGNWGSRKQFLDFGYSDTAGRTNPHSNINTTDTVLTLDGINKRVGIGTTSPGAKLEVEGNGTIGRFVNASSSGSDTGVKIVAARSGDTSGETAYLDLADFDVNEGSAGTEFVMARVAGGMGDVSGQTGFLQFLTNSGKNLSEKMRIDKNGNVGIGTTSPGDRLTVQGGDVDVRADTPRVRVTDTVESNKWMEMRYEDGWGRLYTDGSNIYTNRIFRSDGGFQVDGRWAIASDGSYMRVNSGNKYNKYCLWNGSTYCIGMHSGMTYGGLNDYAMTFTMNNDSDRGFLWRDSEDTQSDGAMSLTTGGVLTVKSSVTASSFIGNASTASALSADPANCAAGKYSTGINASGVADCVDLPSGADNLGNHTATKGLNMNGKNIDFVRGDTSSINSVGRISFDWTGGTYDSSSHHGIESENEGGALSDNLRINSYADIINTIDSNNNSTSQFKVQHQSAANGTDLMTIDEAGNTYIRGNVGIGTTSPGAKLEVKSDSIKYSDVNATANSANAWNQHGLKVRSSNNSINFIASNTVNDRKAMIQAGHADSKYANYLSTLVINPFGGNVGIGTTDPKTKLQVNGTTRIAGGNSSNIQLVDSDNDNFLIHLNSDRLYFMRDDDNDLNWDDGEDDRIVMYGVGGAVRLGIGTSYPEATLDVRGEIRSKGNVGMNYTGITSSGNGAVNKAIVAQDYSQWIWNTATNWGIFWAGNSGAAYSKFGTTNPNEIVFVGGGNSRASIDLDNGNSWFGGSVTASSFIGDGSQLTNLPVTNYSLPEASATTLGGIKVGSNLSISNGVLSATDTNTQLTEADVDEMVDDNGYLTSYTETDPNVNLLGKTSLSCKDGEIPKYDRYIVSNTRWGGTQYGYRWICSSDNNTWRSISSVINSTSTTIAASLSAVKKAYDKGNHSHPYLSTSGGTVSGSITATSFLYSSDENKKKDIQTLSNPLETIQNLRGVSFRWQENDEKSIGFIAQEVEKVLPSLVSGEDGEKSVAYGNLTAVLVEAVKELSAQNKALQERVEALESL